MYSSSNLLQTILLELLKMVGSFILGLLVRRQVGRFLIKKKKWLFNDPVTIDLVSVRTYTPVEAKEFDMSLFHNIQGRIPNVKLDLISRSSMRISMPPFGTLRAILTSESDLEEEAVEEIKVSLDIEDPIRLGVREVDLVHEFSHDVEIVFQIVEKVFVQESTLLRNYTIAEISRTGGLVEEKTFEVEDRELSARVHATPSKITIVAEPPTYVAKAVKKYLLV